MPTRTLLLLAYIIFTNSIFAQRGYEKGRYTTVNGTIVEGYILNEEWENPPNKIYFRNDNYFDGTEISAVAMKGFEIEGEVKYVKALVKFDNSSDRTSTLSYSKSPDLIERTLMLKVLSEDKAILYMYENDGKTRFYISKEEEDRDQFRDEIEPLIYKRYIDVDNKMIIVHNNYFHQQMVNAFRDCIDIPIKKITKTRYNIKSLTAIFDTYNSCFDQIKTD